MSVTAAFLTGDSNDWSAWSDSYSRVFPLLRTVGAGTISSGADSAAPVAVQRAIVSNEVISVGPEGDNFKVWFRTLIIDNFTTTTDAYTFANLLAGGLGGWA